MATPDIKKMTPEEIIEFYNFKTEKIETDLEKILKDLNMKTYIRLLLLS